MPTRVVVDGSSLTSAVLERAAGSPVEVTVPPSALRRVEAAHRVARAVTPGRPVYGRSTGVGLNRGVDVAGRPDHATALLRSHATAAGPLRTPDRVRAMLLVRLDQLAAGGSAVSPAVVRALARMLDADALPPVRELAGIGTGDLAPLAVTALVLAGELAPSGGSAPGVPGVPAVRFGVHDALPFLSSSAATLADAALAVRRLQRTARAAVVVAALSAVALEANPEAFSDPVLHRLPGAGGRLVCQGVRAVLGAVPRPSPRVQDPLGLRCLPAVQGCVLDALSALEDAVDGLLGTAAENPLIVPAAGADGPVHHGLFHLAGLALAADAAAIAVAQSVPLLLSRLGLLADPVYTGLPAFLADGVPGSSGTMLLEYVAAAALGQLRNLAAPASLGSVSLSRGVEEDHSFASQAAIQLLAAGPAYATAVACELVAAVRALRLRGRGARPPGPGPWVDLLDRCAVLPDDVRDRDLTADVEGAGRLLPDLAECLGAAQGLAGDQTVR